MYQELPVNIVGGTYTSRSLPLSAQSCINLYPEINPNAKTPTALQNFFGSKDWLTGSTGLDRGSHKFKGVLYQVIDQTLYSVSSIKVKTSIGTIEGTNRCIFADDVLNMTITTGDKAYVYNGVTLTEITDVDLETPDSVAVINNQAIFDGNSGNWMVATPGDPTDIPDINVAIAEYKGDDLVRVYVFNQTVYLFGTDTIEPWYNSGVGSPPMTRIEGGVVESRGLHAIHSVANTADYIYFLDSDKNVVRMQGYQTQNITAPAIAHQIFKMEASDAIGFTANFEGQDVYIITFPTGDKTFMYSETFDAWSELQYDGGRHLINSYHFVYGKRLITDYRNGNIYELDADTFTDNNQTQIRERVTPPISGISLGVPAKRLKMEWFELLIETGVGLATGQGSSPVILFSTSIDGGRTFDSSGADQVSMGEAGEYLIRVRYDCELEFQDLMIKIRVSDPVFLSIHGASISIEPQEGY